MILYGTSETKAAHSSSVISTVTSGPPGIERERLYPQMSVQSRGRRFWHTLIEPKVFRLENCPKGGEMPHYSKMKEWRSVRRNVEWGRMPIHFWHSSVSGVWGTWCLLDRLWDEVLQFSAACFPLHPGIDSWKPYGPLRWRPLPSWVHNSEKDRLKTSWNPPPWSQISVFIWTGYPVFY